MDSAFFERRLQRTNDPMHSAWWRLALAAALLQQEALATTSPTPPPRQSFVWPYPSHRNDFREGRVYLDPETQNIPRAAEHRGLRPPEPRLPEVYDIFLGLPSFRDGIRCGFTLWTAFARASNPHRLHVGVVDQTQDDDVHCLDEYCRLARQSWPDAGDCKFKHLIHVDARDSKLSTGPIAVRAAMQRMIQNEDFCLTIDAHSQFLPNWDVAMVHEWNRTGNEMAVLSVYPPGFDKMGPNLTPPPNQATHLCAFGGHESFTEMPWFSRVTIDDSEWPQLSPFWGGGLSFSKCHAEKRVPIDPHLEWIFIGEEYVRAMQLWTHGYDIYSPSRHGSVLFHNETKEGGHNGSFWSNSGNIPGSQATGQQSYERLKMVLKFNVTGPVDGRDLDTYYPRPVRSVDAFLNFTGISKVDVKLDRWQCEQLHWIPYEAPDIVESFLPGYLMRAPHGGSATNDVQVVMAEVLQQAKEQDAALLRRVDDTVKAAVQGSLATVLAKLNDASAGTSAAVDAAKADAVKYVQDVLARLDAVGKDREGYAVALQEIQGRMHKLTQPHDGWGDYRQILAVQAVLVLAFLGFCVWSGRSNRGAYSRVVSDDL